MPDAGDALVGPPEELMKEHGLLGRALLIYKHVIEQYQERRPFPSEAVEKVAVAMMTFIHDYHEEMEESYVFPRMQRHRAYADMVKTLWDQHRHGKQLTTRILTSAAMPTQSNTTLNTMVDDMRSFIDMYEPHEFREDSELFPAWHATLSPVEFATIAREMKTKERTLLGPDAFSNVLSLITAVEKDMGIWRLDQFTPKMQISESDD